MADPTKFVPGFDYSDFEQSNPTLPKPGGQLDNDFANIKQTTDQTIDALKQIRRSDGALKNGIVTADSLSPGLIIGIETPQAWQTGTQYAPPDAVFISSGVNQGIYRATILHTSTTFAADLAAGKWELIFNLAAAGLSTVALTGQYADLLNKPVLGTAAATDADEYATAAQGGLADSAVQPGDLADVATSGEYDDLTGKPFTVPAGGATGQTLIKTSNANGAYAWQSPPGGGDMLASLYDPQGIDGDAFDRGNHTGEQAIETITGLVAALNDRATDAELAAAIASILGDAWALQPLGSLIAANMGVTGFVAPPKDKAYRYILLSAGQTGTGAYNEGVLTSEVVSGSQPVVSAYATINLTGSIFTGQTVRLINTERRFLRAGSPGTLQDSAFGSHSHTYNDPGHKHTLIADGASGLASIPRIDNQGISNQKFFNDATSVATTGITINANGDTETRSRNIGVDYYMRIK